MAPRRFSRTGERHLNPEAGLSVAGEPTDEACSLNAAMRLMIVHGIGDLIMPFVALKRLADDVRRRDASGPGCQLMTRRLALILWLLIGGTGVRAADLATLSAARWGMAATDLDRAFGDQLVRLPGRWDFGPFYADFTLPEIEVAGYAFRAFFQMERKTDRLGQILLERRGGKATPMVFDDVVRALSDHYGELAETSTGTRGIPTALRAIWRLPDLVVEASFFDFYTTGMFFEDPNTARNPLVPYYQRRRNNPRFLPRRALIRLHPPA
jgi:hypothetical protein